MPDDEKKGDGEDGANGNGGTDEFWFTVGTELIKSRVTRIETAADKFVTGIAWFWSAYTASALAGIALANRTLGPIRLVIVALPSVVLIGAYLFALYALMPVYQKFDPRIPEDVRQKEEARTTEKQKRLQNTGIATAVGALFVAVAIITVLSAPEAGPTTFKAEFGEASAEGSAGVLFSGRIVGEKGIAVHVSVVPKGGTSKKEAAPATEELATASESGAFSGMTDPVPVDDYDIIASWTTDSGTTSVSVELKGPGDESSTSPSPA